MQQQPSGELLSSVFAHETGNSLHSISIIVNSMERHFQNTGEADQPTGELLRLMMQEINRLILMLDDFRSSRLFSLDLQTTSLASVIQDCLALKSLEASGRSIRIECSIPRDLPSIVADPAKLKQVFLNLYANAVDAMPEGGILRVKAGEREDAVCLDVADTGGSIPEDMQIFEPFVTGKSNGTGLGLPVVKWIVLAHGGTISYTSIPGQGTTFHLSFPVCGSQRTTTVQGPALLAGCP